MLDGNETQQVLDFAFSHKIIFASAAGTVVTFGFLVGRYVFDRQLSILNQENLLIEERLRKAQAEAAESDPITEARIKGQRVAADRGAAFRFFISVAVLLTLVLSGGCVYMLNQVSVRENQHYTDEAGRQDGLAADVRSLEALLKAKPTITAPVRPKQAMQEPASKSASK